MRGVAGSSAPDSSVCRLEGLKTILAECIELSGDMETSSGVIMVCWQQGCPGACQGAELAFYEHIQDWKKVWSELVVYYSSSYVRNHPM